MWTVLEIKDEIFTADDVVEEDDSSDYVRELEKEVNYLKKRLYDLRQFIPSGPGGPG